MYTLFFTPTANGYKVLVMLEALGAQYDICHINLSRNEQHLPAFSRLNRHAKIPVLLDRDNQQLVAESGAILLYLAEKHGRFIGASLDARWQVLQWLMWQVSSLGPMAGQNYHFNHQVPEAHPYSADRYVTQTHRLFQVFEQALALQPYICGDYSIADMSIFPWMRLHRLLRINLDGLPRTTDYLHRMTSRADIQRAYAIGAPYQERLEGDVDRVQAIADALCSGQ